MRFTSLFVALAATAGLTLAAVAAPAFAGEDPHAEPLVLGVDAAVQVQTQLGRPADSPLCGFGERPIVFVADDDLRVLFCVAADVAAEIEADLEIDLKD